MIAVVEHERKLKGGRRERTRFVHVKQRVRTVEHHEARIRGRWVPMEPPRPRACPVEDGDWIEYHEARGWDVQEIGG